MLSLLFSDSTQESQPVKSPHSPPLLSVDNHWKVAEDAKIDSVIAQAQAINSEPGSMFTFGLEANEKTNETLPFKINPFTGIVSLNESLEGQGGKSFVLYVTVTDGIFTAKSGVFVNIKFKSVNEKQNVTVTYPVSVSPVDNDTPSDQPPINLPPILQIDNQWNITEDAEVDSMLAQAQAVDPDPSDMLTFGLESGDEFDDKTLPFRINLYSGIVYLNESLKGRSGEKIFMYVTVNDGAHNAKDGVYVKIIPKSVLPDDRAVNTSNRHQKSNEAATTNLSAKQNSPPVLLVDNQWNIPENAEINSVISKVKSADADAEDKLIFGLESADKYEDETLPFRIDPNTAIVYLNESLKGRGGENLTLFVTVTDGTYNAKNSVNVKITSNTALKVNNNETYPTLPNPPNHLAANDSDDQQQNSNQTSRKNASPEQNSPPVLLVDNQWNIPEDAEINSIVAKTQATDADPNDMLTFGLEFGDVPEEETLPLRINPFNGIVYLNDSLEGRADEFFLLYITVSDGTYSVKNGVYVQIIPKISSEYNQTAADPVSPATPSHTNPTSSNDQQHKTNETVKAYGTFVVHTKSMKSDTPKLQIVNYLYFYIFISLLLFRNLHQL